MTLPKARLLPARHDDRAALLGTLELVARGRLQFAQSVGAEVGQRMALEPCPQVFDRIEIGRIGRQEGNLQLPLSAVQVFAHERRAMRSEPVPDDEQWP